ncbi:hypothetical protein F6X37_11035 [Paraburkholderia sp. 31.1]|uniref:hypothetical protein n=1 Tax=Paraburkholderia sp. 31.1 TaxID=2615205 RepID=UPI001656571E|nr:hypothetical protein [Paraburkholderia sp. 31.1]MBC8722108.1 hypothetical protein [Paraburkholderia sp. 31.1]
MSWLKIESSTPDKPEVWAIAAFLSLDRDAVMGKLIRVWRWFDEHTADGNARSVTRALVDSTAGVTGFADAMISVRWLTVDDNGISMPHFEWHTGAKAKRRARTAIRVSRHKNADSQGNAEGNADANARGNAQANAEGNAASVSTFEKCVYEVNLKPKTLKPKTKNIRASRFDAQARLESLGVEPQIARDWLTLRSGKRLKPTETAFAGVLREAQKAGLSMNDVLRVCCTRGWGSFEASWLHGHAHGAQAPPPALTPLQQREAENRRVAQGLTRTSGPASGVIEGGITEAHRVGGEGTSRNVDR